jgi:hypothetical protein
VKTTTVCFLALVFIVLYGGCKDSQQQQQLPVKQEPNLVSENQNNENATTEIPQKVSKDFEGLKLTKKDPMPAKELVEFLPEKFSGESFPASTMKSERDNYSHTMARKQYSVAGGGVITISITDYGGSALLNIKGYEMPAPEIGISIEKILLPEGVGYKTFNPNNNSGMIAALVGGRFGIDIEAVNIAKNFGDIAQILEKVNIDGLLKKAK